MGDRKGRFELAGSGTIFLDEIGDTTPGFQAKILRVLQDGDYYPVGGERPRRTDARVIAATHRSLEEQVQAGTFREDLYFRLRVVEIRVPPLRERREDIPRLARTLLARITRDLHKDVRAIPDAVMARLQAYDWPGNVRELENVLTRAVVIAHGPAISIDDVTLGSEATAAPQPPPAPHPTDDSLAAVESAHVQRVLDRMKGNKRRSAQALGVSRPRLDRIIKKYGLTIPD